MKTITQTYWILQLNEDGKWFGLQTFWDYAAGEAAMAQDIALDPEGCYRLLEKSYETQVRED